MSDQQQTKKQRKTTMKNKAAQALGRIRTAKKAQSSRENGKKGGRPKGPMGPRFIVSIHNDGGPTGLFASVQHVRTGWGRDFYFDGHEYDWQDGNGLEANGSHGLVRQARQSAFKQLPERQFLRLIQESGNNYDFVGRLYMDKGGRIHSALSIHRGCRRVGKCKYDPATGQSIGKMSGDLDWTTEITPCALIDDLIVASGADSTVYDQDLAWARYGRPLDVAGAVHHLLFPSP